MSCSLVALALLPLVAVAQPPSENQGDAATPPQMQQMQSQMQAMHEQMARIHATTDPGERQRLMQEHMQTMHEGMTMMGQMMQGPMTQGQARQCAQSDTECRMDQMQTQQQMMGQRMGMMQQMMEQMMERMMHTQEPEAPAATTPEGSHESHH
jgi:hypothetical protein